MLVATLFGIFLLVWLVREFRPLLAIVGIVAVVWLWRLQAWSRKKKIFVGILLLTVLGARIKSIDEGENDAKFASADSLWEGNQRVAATAIYRRIFHGGLELSEPNKATLLSRLLDFDATGNLNRSEAQEVTDRAHRDQILLAPQSADGIAFLTSSSALPPAGKVTSVVSAPSPDPAIGSSAGQKYAVFLSVVRKYKQWPGRDASENELRRYNSELEAIQNAFFAVPFNGSIQATEAKQIIDSWRKDMEGQGYSGYLYNLLEEAVMNIESQYRER